MSEEPSNERYVILPFLCLAGAAHLLNANAGVLRVTPQEQKSCLEYKGKSYLDKFIQ